VRLSRAAVLVLALSGCFRTTVKNGEPVAAAAVEWNERWHDGLVFGLTELSGPYDLSRLCPRGWAEIHTETPLLQGLVTVLTLNIYTPQSVTIRCRE
jgi:hypothetical protein